MTHSRLIRIIPLALVFLSAACLTPNDEVADAQPTSQPCAPERRLHRRVRDRTYDCVHQAACVERELEHWTPPAHHYQRPPDAILAPDMDPTGMWFRIDNAGSGGGGLFVDRSDSVRFMVRMKTCDGCYGAYSLYRAATYRNGVLTLVRPVDSFGDTPYQRIFAIRIGGLEALVPSSVLEDFERILRDHPNDSGYLAGGRNMPGFIRAEIVGQKLAFYPSEMNDEQYRQQIKQIDTWPMDEPGTKPPWDCDFPTLEQLEKEVF